MKFGFLMGDSVGLFQLAKSVEALDYGLMSLAVIYGALRVLYIAIKMGLIKRKNQNG
jgi:hypothetical protein